ncbi:n-acetyltransferase [Grosmannia clavigera kw1407]|uniref:N-acetyltransferase n=1 Tax=Grosmannia clavigera (strain kw1407 / UAMH 11150) TaxID=655863 RepID=F0XUW1_GROCL|nr:n-acetyltransferase [Grosmannia clavigera kw1407]EFW98940.1 n-acetyltransferase [Grosmannia clavigera kw1407]
MASLSSSTTITTVSASAVSDDHDLPVPPSLVPAQWQDTVRVIGMSECREAALSLSHAFAADALSLYLVPSADEERGPGLGRGRGRGGRLHSAEDRWRLHVNIMTYIVASVALNGIVTTIGPDYDGVALWLGPGQSVDGWWTSLRSGLWRLHLQLSPEGHRRYYDELMPLLHQTKIEPSARRRGYAQKLLEHVFVKADAEKRPIYLESSSATNNRFYSKFGFEYKKDISLVRGKTPVGLSIMVRGPQTAISKKLSVEHV